MKRYLWLALPLLVLLAILILTGCGGHHPTAGQVLDKKYTAAHYGYWTSSQCYMYGKYGCQVWIPVQHREYIADRWELEVQSDKGEIGWVNVTQYVYDHESVGDRWSKQ